MTSNAKEDVYQALAIIISRFPFKRYITSTRQHFTLSVAMYLAEWNDWNQITAVHIKRIYRAFFDKIEQVQRLKTCETKSENIFMKRIDNVETRVKFFFSLSQSTKKKCCI